MISDIFAVIVTYNPDITSLKDVVLRVFQQSGAVAIVDNASENQSEIRSISQTIPCEFIQLPENKGIAYAQNAGISSGIAQGAKYILLMDQDTVLPDETVHTLFAECDALERDGVKVGAVGCAYQDTHDGLVSAVWKASGYRLKRQKAPDDSQFLLSADFVIASGSLLPVTTLKDVGLMDAALFIDLVDIEWGLRARARGYQNYQSFSTIMMHTLGNGRKKILWKKVSLHNPIRDYYSIRNSILLARRRYVGTAWRLYFIRRVLLYFIVFGLFTDQKKTRLHFLMRGLIDGIYARGGPYEA